MERVFGSVRQKYSILGSKCPIDFVMRKSKEDTPFWIKLCLCAVPLQICVHPSCRLSKRLNIF